MNSDSLIKVDVKDMVLLIKQKQNFYLSLLVTQVEAKKSYERRIPAKLKFHAEVILDCTAHLLGSGFLYVYL